MNILITGVQNMIKDSTVKLALERIEGKVKLKVLSFSDFAEEEGSGELQLLKSTQKKLTESIQLKMIESGPHHIVINGYCTVSTRLGYVPVITKESVNIFRPDLIACIETDPAALPKLENPREFQEHQAIERQFSVLFALRSGAAIKIIRSGKEGAREGADKLFSLLKEALVPR